MGNSISAPFSGLANRRLGRKPILWLFSFSPFTCNIYDIDVVAQSGAVEASSLESVNPEQIVDQQQQPQPQPHLLTKDNNPVTYHTKWSDLHPDSQNFLTQIEWVDLPFLLSFLCWNVNYFCTMNLCLLHLSVSPWLQQKFFFSLSLFLSPFVKMWIILCKCWFVKFFLCLAVTGTNGAFAIFLVLSWEILSIFLFFCLTTPEQI